MISAGALAALARKYGALSALRARRDAGGEGPSRAELRALAAEFPGCLRELDTLGARELVRRAAACQAAATADAADAAGAGAGAGAGAALEPWMPWIAEYHALMRAALEIRAGRAVAGAPAAPPTIDSSFSPPLSPSFAAEVLRPPGGRVGVVVLRAVAARAGVPAATIAAALFPVRRPSPYSL